MQAAVLEKKDFVVWRLLENPENDVRIEAATKNQTMVKNKAGHKRGTPEKSDMLIRRYDKNPVVSPDPDCRWGSARAKSPAVVYDGERFHMVFTGAPEGGGGRAPLYLGYASSTDGFHFERAAQPLLAPSDREGDFDWGTVEDARVTPLDGRHYIAYAARAALQCDITVKKRPPRNTPNDRPTWNRNFRRVGLAATDNFSDVQRLGPITSELVSDANVVLFPERIHGRYAMLHRPTPFIPGNHACHYAPGRLFIAYSDNLTSWFRDDENALNRAPENDHLLMAPEQDWEAHKIGGAGVPIKTEEGWLSFYHAKDKNRVYRCGLILLDREDPGKVIARTPEPVFEPETVLEREGRVKNTIFPCSHIVVNDEVLIYYGASGEYVCVATARLDALLETVLRHRIRD